MREITQRKFDAYCYVRQPLVRVMTREVAWYEAANRKILAVIIFDIMDNDFGFVILGRDARNLFRCIEVSSEFYSTSEQAKDHLEKSLEAYARDGKVCYSQGDERTPPNEIFNEVVRPEKLHPYFVVLKNELRFEAARNLIKEIAYSFVDVDGNYIQQFQSDGFDSRLWELFLYVFLYDSGFDFNRSYNAPDYCLNKLGYECTVEAVTVGANPDFDEPNAKCAEDIISLSKDYIPIKFGSALHSKISRKPPYWEMEHVKGKPFILAIHDYHKLADGVYPGSMTWTRAGLKNYLYGMREDVIFNKDGNPELVFEQVEPFPIPKIIKTKTHKWKKKEIPSYFFTQKKSEYVSAVLFSNAATITTFNRMGKLAGLGSREIRMLRKGMKAHPDPSSFMAMPFLSDVDEESYEEAWADSVVMFHNPFAKNPVDPEMFPEISHINYDPEVDDFMAIVNPNEVFSSTTIVLSNNQKHDDADKDN